MSTLSNKAQERLLYLISPIGLLVVWQLLLMAGFGDRRFIPAPTDIAVRFWQLTVSGELAVHTAATLWRVFAGFVIGAVQAVALALDRRAAIGRRLCCERRVPCWVLA